MASNVPIYYDLCAFKTSNVFFCYSTCQVCSLNSTNGLLEFGILSQTEVYFDNYAILGYYAASSGNLLATYRCNLSVRLQGSRIHAQHWRHAQIFSLLNYCCNRSAFGTTAGQSPLRFAKLSCTSTWLVLCRTKPHPVESSLAARQQSEVLTTGQLRPTKTIQLYRGDLPYHPKL